MAPGIGGITAKMPGISSFRPSYRANIEGSMPSILALKLTSVLSKST